MKIMIVFGTRPEVIKLAPIVTLLRTEFRDIHVCICATGQHRDMQSQALEAFEIMPDYDLDVMLPNQTLDVLTCNLMSRMTEVLMIEKPDWVLVQGDTTTAFVAGLAAFYQQISVGHVEAGLRTGQLQSPFPEELNRQMLGRIATLHFAPTELAATHLLKENVDPRHIHVTGNTVVDAVDHIKKRFDGVSLASRELVSQYAGRLLVLVTCHRRETFGAPLLEICAAIEALSSLYPEMIWIYPVHPNPNVLEVVESRLSHVKNVVLIDPLDYLSTLYLMSVSTLVLTDSGGIQEEAPSFQKPVVVMRDHTERQEGIAAGCAKLAGVKKDHIIRAVQSFLEDRQSTQLALKHNPYGDGKAALRIVKSLLKEPVEAFYV